MSIFSNGYNVALNVEGMTCNHCAKTVTEALSAVDGVKKVKVDLKKNLVRVSTEKDVDNLEIIKASITKAGYKVV
jgi:copper ion binding protein